MKEIGGKSVEEIQACYPIEGNTKGWYFKFEEVSNGVYEVEGSDLYGRLVSRTDVELDDLLQLCNKDAENINKQ